MPTIFQRNYSDFYQKRRPCPQCGREDRVCAPDYLFIDANDIYGNMNSFHIILFPRVASLMFRLGLLNDRSFLSIYGALGTFPFSMFGFLSTRNFFKLLLICTTVSSYIFHRYSVGVTAIVNDLTTGECGSVLTKRVGAQSKFCFFRSAWDVFSVFYVCTYEH